MPTEAELEYAVLAGGKCDCKVYVDDFRTREVLVAKGLLDASEKDKKGMPDAYRSLRIFERTPMNPWKIIGGWTNCNQMTLDRVDVPDGAPWHGNATENLVYANEEVDPLRNGNRFLKRQWSFARWLTGNSGGLFRLVVGPDLVAEKKAAKK